MDIKVVYMGADHAGLKLKNQLKQYLRDKNINVQDVGAHALKNEDDYPDYAARVTKKVKRDQTARGILICGSGHGMCIAANRQKGIRAILGYTVGSAILGRDHNDSNVLCLAGRFLTLSQAQNIVDAWLETPFTNTERHLRRIKKLK